MYLYTCFEEVHRSCGERENSLKGVKEKNPTETSMCRSMNNEFVEG